MNDPRLNIYIPPGAPATAIPREVHMLVFRILNNLNFSGGASLQITDDGNWTIAVDGLNTIEGKREPYKVTALRGYKKNSNSSAWQEMTLDETNAHDWSGYQRDKSEYVDGIHSYPWYALAPSFDYLRAIELPES